MITLWKKINHGFGKNVFTFFLVMTLFVGIFPVYGASTIPSPCATPFPSGTPGTPPSTFSDAVCLVVGFLDALGPTIVGITLLVFLWGLMRFIGAGGDEKRIQEGKDLMFWGVIALFVMVSIWAIVATIFSDFFGPGQTFGIPYLST